MEKVITIAGDSKYDMNNAQEQVNRYLEQGWSLKSITTSTTKEFMCVIFVLEK